MGNFLPDVVHLQDFLIKSALAVLCGGLIGVERELKRKPAGFRTNILICVGATYFTTVSAMLGGLHPDRPGDPARIAAQVVTGIGFLGAGAIIQSRGRIAGLTTAALIWTVASVGVLIGAGLPVLALAGTFVVFMTLTVFGLIEHRMLSKCRYFDCVVVFKDDDGKTRRLVARRLATTEKALEHLQFKKTNGTVSLTIQYCDVHPEHRRLLYDLWNIEGVEEVRPLR